MMIELTEEEKQTRIDRSEKLYPIMQRILLSENEESRRREHFWMVGLNSQGIILYIELVALGKMNIVYVETNSLFTLAMNKGARTVYAVHNHPSGKLGFSKEDLDATDKLMHMGITLHVPLADHLVITETEFKSLFQTPDWEILRVSTKYMNPVLRMEMEAEYNSWKYIRKSADKDLKKGETLEQIAESFGMSVNYLKQVLDISDYY